MANEYWRSASAAVTVSAVVLVAIISVVSGNTAATYLSFVMAGTLASLAYIIHQKYWSEIAGAVLLVPVVVGLTDVSEPQFLVAVSVALLMNIVASIYFRSEIHRYPGY